MNETLISKGTVYSLKAHINKENVTNKGYFCLEKIKNLRVENKGFLKDFRTRLNQTQAQLAQLINVPLSTYIGWEQHNKSLSINKLISICKKLRISKKELNKIINEARLSYGLHHGSTRLNLPTRVNNFRLVKYLIPHNNDRVYLIKSAPIFVKKQILKSFKIDRHHFKKSGLITIYSSLLNKFLKTFYTYQRESVLKFPLSTEVKNWINQGADLNKAVIIPLLLSDGGAKPKNRLFISGASSIVHNLWTDAFYYRYDILPSSFLLPYSSIFVTTHRVNETVLSELKNLCKGFKKSPHGQLKEEYLDSPQPSIAYLYKSKKIEQQIALRIWAITEGSVGINLDRRYGLINPIIKIACANPTLIKQLKDISKMNGINFYIDKRSEIWSGLSCLKSSSIKSVIAFLKIGGFIKGVKIAKSKSKYFGGLDKQDVLLGILEFTKGQRENKKLRYNDKDKVYKAIRKLVINREFKNEEYYLDLFKEEKFDNWYFRRKKCS